MEIISKPLNRIIFVMMSLFVSVITFAQDAKKVDVKISTGGDGGNGFFASPWVWVVGGAVFILLLVALLRGGSRKDA
ncbi:MAG: hypothetical protein LH478_12230 [Chitinophagaceae bacterium]|nr:hypothetical protein [Chitinophagaceae bacterium]